MSREEVNFDLERMKKAIEGPFRTIPAGLTREQLRQWMLEGAEQIKEKAAHDEYDGI